VPLNKEAGSILWHTPPRYEPGYFWS